ncbi:DNA repair protein [Acidovorax phage ACP17]|uniref:Recombination protein n=1 Tax=Acidovorax phage ACP17 TaxID=2010329 RepID=A0A218M2X6_9CAUD|nr:DNA repair protein [Acidovorax phage ACP17]ASD50397.1 recombination protein [Acidovorax phage ACP17]
MSLTARLLAKSTIKMTSVFSESKLFDGMEQVPTAVPLLNVALGGSIDSGLRSGLGVMAGPSKHFKTSFTLLMVAAYLKKYKDAVCLFYDSEFGAPQSYFKAFGIDPNRVIHTPINNIEELKFDVIQQLEEIKRSDKVIIIIDSIGNLASKKEVEDAKNEKSVADMTRAKQLKSLFRMVTPYLTTKDIPMIAINHTYQTQEMYSKAVVSGGTGIYYSANWIFIIGRSQEKDGDELEGYKFTINIEKSRLVKEKSKLPITVSFESGIEKWSGMLDLAVEMGYVVKPKNGWYTRPCVPDDKSWRAAAADSNDFWKPVFANSDFAEAIAKKFQLSAAEMLEKDAIEDVETLDDDGVIETTPIPVPVDD